LQPIFPAATVILLRDSANGLEVFMVRRHENLAFMGGAYVFPGGRVDEADYEADESWCDGVSEARAQLAECSPREAVGYHVAAVRELFEEGAVLLARGGDVNAKTLSRVRNDLVAAPHSFGALMQRERLRVDLGALVLCAHWITPPRLPRRFDTRFFAARMPLDQHALHDSGEMIDSTWITPAAALARGSEGSMELPPPTRHTLEAFRNFATVESLLAAYRGRPVERRAPQ